MNPIIGITGRTNEPNFVEKYYQIYMAAIRKAGGIPLLITPESYQPGIIDGLLLSGGGDINPECYGEENTASRKINDRRDEMEIDLLRKTLNRNVVPILAICRGFQILNVLFGGKLIQHIDGHQGALKPNEDLHFPISHPVSVIAGNPLHQAMPDPQATVNSNHHQAVADNILGRGLQIAARHGEVVEGVVMEHHRWVVGVQWHPERYLIEPETFSDPAAQARLFADFIQAAK